MLALYQKRISSRLTYFQNAVATKNLEFVLVLKIVSFLVVFFHSGVVSNFFLKRLS